MNSLAAVFSDISYHDRKSSQIKFPASREGRASDYTETLLHISAFPVRFSLFQALNKLPPHPAKWHLSGIEAEAGKSLCI